MNVLLLGSGGREHAIAWKLAQSRHCKKLFIAPGNAGTLSCGANVALDPMNFDRVADFVIENSIGLVIPGPEAPLVAGIYDYFRGRHDLSHVGIIGPGIEGARLEGSKMFAKEFMVRNNIPTAAYFTVTSETFHQGCRFLEELRPPYVLKADGLAAGKGVIILSDLQQAKETLNEMLNGMFGLASKSVVIEEYLDGIELSCFFVFDGTDYRVLPEAKDYKRAGDNNSGLNTGGMGSVSPVPFANSEFKNKVEEKIIKPTVQGLINENIDYRGFVFVGLMNVRGEPFVIEYNVRLGDPETESVLPRVKNDFLEMLMAVSSGTLKPITIDTDERCVVSIMLVSQGYPGKYEKGKEIKCGSTTNNELIFHAGTKVLDGKIFSDGGRVISAGAFGNSLAEAIKNAYAVSSGIGFENKYFRSDIGFDLL
ncbi:MAG: phosphoribosylamine--glycine ligase [Bacteroidales bacterium]|nr:phosphoribosylamine--glycine ligase [Bacteroidales bacterium]HOY39539.1 phosphoribosylamine--glycine ligase [Bacteroidales bacterium]HQP04613.1 phosphoribosylamine--glycine ligase [Bacteroidales bacterium]